METAIETAMAERHTFIPRLFIPGSSACSAQIDLPVLACSAKLPAHGPGLPFLRLHARRLARAADRGATLVGNTQAGIKGILCAVGTLLLLVLQSALVVRRLRPRPNGMFLGPARITVDAEGALASARTLDAEQTRVHAPA